MKNSNKMIFGVVLVLIGLIFIADSIGLHFITFGSLFPIILIGLGFWLILRRRKMELKSEEADSFQVHVNIHNDPPQPPPVEPMKPFSQSEPAQPASSAEPMQSSEPIQSSEPFDPKDYAEKQSQGSSYTFRNDSSQSSKFQFNDSENPSDESNGKLKYNKFLGDMNISFKNRQLQEIEISTFIGDTKIDLDGAELSLGLNRVIISGFIGDVKVFVPKGMAVFANCSNFLGDIEACGRKNSGFGNNLECQSDNYSSADKKIYIAVNGFIGDIKLIES